MKRVVITGMGGVSPIGLSVDEIWENAKLGKNGLKQIEDTVLTDMGIHVAGTIPEYEALDHFSKKEKKNIDRTIQLGVTAARQAAADAKLDQIENRYSIGTCVSSGIGGIQTIEDQVEKGTKKGYKWISPYFIPNAIINLVSGQVAIDLNIKGSCTTVVTACATGTDSIGTAYHNILLGKANVMIAGATESATTYVGLSGFNNMKALSNATDINRASIPFSKDRHGFVMGEGAGVLVLEEYEHAIKRGVKIYGEIISYSSSCDANHITAPDPEAKSAIYGLNDLIKDVNMSEINYFNTHGTSTKLNEKTESKMLNEVFGDHLKNISITASKSMTGHLLGAAGAIEAIITLKSLQENFVTPTINIEEIDEELNVDIVRKPLKKDLKYGISSSLGFGGHNSFLMFRGEK